MNRTSQRIACAAVAVSAAVFAGCGGGGDDATPVPPATSQVPASASASIDGFIAYLKDLVVSSADLLDPVDTSTVLAPPSDDTVEPVPVN